MKAGKIRPMAVCALWRGAAVLAQEGRDPQTGAVYYRLPGGGIEFGEYAQAAAIREIREELEAEVIGIQPLGILENLYEYDGLPYHEIIFFFTGSVAEPLFYDQDELTGYEGVDDAYRAIWLPLADVAAGRVTLYPTELLPLLTNYHATMAAHESE